ncbi:hypothetical protein OEZ85_006934 [Tetradesmus obliquus]|uniref:RRM domain-containing protein n=1 Tax=Tetradesmus obliquus TaxID=3088 RepID=A0ABY8TYK8_TETOB|nr:hypothetical protein OEZ85_006934 [Tetradesmus obliquus]
MTVEITENMPADVATSHQQPVLVQEFASKTAIARSPVLRLRGLPFLATTLDVKEFFSGFDLSDVYICRRNGRSTGEAYVVLHTQEAAQDALLQLNKKYMANRYIELFEAAEADLAAVKKVLEDSRLQGFVVRLRGLPYSASHADITLFLEGVALAEVDDAIVMAVSVDSRPTGEAYVELGDEQALSLAMTRHKELMGNRYIEVFNSSKVDKLMALQQARFHLDGQPRSRWMPRGPGGIMGPNGFQQQMMVMPGSSSSYTSGMADQLADALSATHLSVSPPHGGMGAACMLSYPAASAASVSPPNSAAAAAIAAGQRFLASPAASAASSAEFRMQQQQVVAVPADMGQMPGYCGARSAAMAAAPYQMAPSPMMVSPDGQTMYYMPPPQGMWPGQPRGMPAMPASAALVDASAAMAGAMRPMMMPADAVPQCMQPGIAPMMVPAPGMQQYAAPPYHQWAQGPGAAMRMMPGCSANAGYVYSQPGQ